MMVLFSKIRKIRGKSAKFKSVDTIPISNTTALPEIRGRHSYFKYGDTPRLFDIESISGFPPPEYKKGVG